MSQESSRLAAAFQVSLTQFREIERRRTGSGQYWTFSEPDHTYCRSEQACIQDDLATLSGGSLDQSSQEEDEEQEDEEDYSSNKDDDEAKNEEVEDDGEEGQGQEERDNNSAHAMTVVHNRMVT